MHGHTNHRKCLVFQIKWFEGVSRNEPATMAILQAKSKGEGAPGLAYKVMEGKIDVSYQVIK